MKVLMIADEVESPEKVNSFSRMWTYYLRKALRAQGVEVTMQRRFNSKDDTIMGYISEVLDASLGYDCILATGVRYFTMIPAIIGRTLRREFPGIVAQIYDGSLLDKGNTDVTFTVRDDTYKYLGDERLSAHEKYNTYAGWAADEDLFYPEKDGTGKLNIFIDHPAFDRSQLDYSLNVLINLEYLPVEANVYTLDDGGLLVVDEDYGVQPYHRKSIPAPEFAAQLRKADIFISTHKESLGQTIIEAARCGALVLCPDGFAPADRLKSVVRLNYGSRIDWKTALAMADKERCYNRVKDCTWGNVAKRIIADIYKRNK